MKVKRILLFMAAAIAAAGLTGCSQKEKDYDVYFFNAKSEIAESLDELAKKYEEETGKRVKTFTVGTAESAETMRSELKSKAYPTVFTSNSVAFEEWKSAGFAVGAEDILNPELKALYENLPDSIRLQFDGEGNYGIPYNIEGYGLIADRRMIMGILDLDESGLEQFKADYQEADYKEFQDMVIAIDALIKGEGGREFTLNGSPYATAGAKEGITESLNGVFSIAGAEKWTYGNHFGNYPISTVYKNTYDVRGSEPEKAELLKTPIIKSLQELDFLTRYAAGPDGPVERGPRFINSTVTGYDQAVQTLGEGKAVFIKNGNWIYSNVAKVSEDVAENLIMLPMKLNFDDSDITVEGLDVKQMNRSVPEFVSQYYVINAKATEEERKDAEDFVLWLNTSETGQDFVINRFAFVPFNADENTVLDNPLSNDLIRYKLEGNLLSNPFDAAPSTWGTEMYGKYLMEQLFINPGDWDEGELEKIADDCIAYWKSGMDEW